MKYFTFKKLGYGLLLVILLIACSKPPEAIDSNGQLIQFNNFKDKWLILNYWAEWCKPCHEEIPALNQFYNTHKNNVIILGINFDNSSVEITHKFIEKYKINYPMLVTNPGPALGIKEIPSLPATFLLSPDRKKMITLFGAQTEQTLLAAMQGNA